ncbi:MAG: 4,5-DOPA dioxygenase extradiol [Bacteroidota bacterium]
MTAAFGAIKTMADTLPENGALMPVLFIGHGSPMNGIENNEFSDYWTKLAAEMPQPTAVICISAHWLTRGTFITAADQPQTIHDFGGFPQALFDVQYPAPGNPALAEETTKLFEPGKVGLDHEWGLDHGTWTVVKHMYPKANIPVLQLSIDYYQNGMYHYELAKNLAALRKKGVLIMGSGNMVHNLRMVAFDKLNEKEYGFDWAHEMNAKFKELITNGDYRSLAEYEKLGPSAKLAVPTPDHYWPLMYILGLQQKNEEPVFFNDRAVGGSLTMTSVRFG